MIQNNSKTDRVQCGVDHLSSVDRYLRHQRIGLLTTAASVDQNWRSTVERLHERYHLRALFAPEHGLFGEKPGGLRIEQELDQQTRLPVYSLYGSEYAPTSSQLADLDVFVIDLQDPGVRCHSFIYSMGYAMESCARAGLPVVILDRPNPLGGRLTEGIIPDRSNPLFSQLYAVPVRYGLTIGELARYINSSRQLNCSLQIASLSDWSRHAYFDQTHLPWVAPGPDLPTPDSLLLYSGICLFSGTNVSDGRGTAQPYSFIGAPWFDPERVSKVIQKRHLAGFHLRSCRFQPTNGKYKDQICNGFQIHLLDRTSARPLTLAVSMLQAIRQTHAEFKFTSPRQENQPWAIDLIFGDDRIRQDHFNMENFLDQARQQEQSFILESRESWLYQE